MKEFRNALSYILYALILVTVGCSTLSKEECVSLDWQERGASDVYNNKSWLKQLADYQETCKKHEIAVPGKLYKKGVKHAGAIMCSGKSNFHFKGWKGVGKSDALNGKRLSYFNSYSDNCSFYGVVPKEKPYKKGYQLGIKNFCSLKSGLRFGSNGGTYNNTCSGPSEDLFRKGYQVGEKIYKADSLEKELSSTESRISRIRDEITDTQNEIGNLNIKLSHEGENFENRIRSIEGSIQDKRNQQTAAIISGDTTRSNILAADILSERNELNRLRNDRSYERRRIINEISDKNREFNSLLRELSEKEGELSNLRFDARVARQEANEAKRQLK